MSHGRTASREISREAHGGGLYGLNPVASLFSFMSTKEEALQNLKASGDFKNFADTHYWRAAFELYNKATGSKLTTHRVCAKCFSAVSEWLQS